MIINLDELDLVKAVTWREELYKRDSSGRFAKQVGQKAIRKGSKVVAKNGATGKVVDSTDTHYHIEKDDGKQAKVLKHNVLHEDEHKELTKPKGKGKKTNDKKVPTKPKTTTKGAQPGATTKPSPTGKPTKPTDTTKPSGAKSGSKTATKPKTSVGKDTKGATASATTKPKTKTPKGEGANAKLTVEPGRAGKPVRGTKASTTKGKATNTPATTKKEPVAKKSPAKKAPSKEPAKATRSDVQKNRSLAYDVGDKIGGARKDDFEKTFKEKPTLANLARLEKDNGALAEKMVTKANLLPKFSFEDEHKNGTELQTAIMKKLIFDRISPKPEENTPEGRRAYMESMIKLQRHIAGVKSWDNMRNAIRELSDIGYKSARGRHSEHSMARYTSNPERFSYINEEHHTKNIEEGNQARAMLDMEPLGEKLRGFFVNADKRESTMNTVRKNMKEGWDKYLNPADKPSTKKPPVKQNHIWEREAVSEVKRVGGKKMVVDKPEELIKNFGVRGVEFGNWVNDSSGKFHLQRCAEAFSDLADITGIDDKDISLNGRLAIAFGARGKAGALAHYEPAKKVINMTKYGGAGSLAHEWGHAMDNILAQYSNGGVESMSMASDGMGDHDPVLKVLYENLISSIKDPIPGEPGVVNKVQVSSDDPNLRSYSPSVARTLKNASSDEEGIKQVIAEWQQKDFQKKRKISNLFKMAQAEPNASMKKSIEKSMNKEIRERKKAKDEIPKHIAYGMYLKNDRKEHWSGTVEMPEGTSEYMNRMTAMDNGNVGKYYSQSVEMFARVFESYAQEKLESNKRSNNYLVHGTRESAVKALGAPFPVGKERKAMFKAMENLLKHVSSKKALKKALIMDMVASHGEELRKSMDGSPSAKRSAFNVDWTSFDEPLDELLYIPINRLSTPYQTEKATNWDKVTENVERMIAGENLEPIVIGLDYDVHDGHHRYEASKLANYEHVPCIVKGGNEIERQRAIEAYKELYKSIQYDPVAEDAFEEDNAYMYRGIGQRELDFIKKNGYVQTKGKGNDDDKGDSQTCFSNLYSQAVGYAKTNYDLYNEKQAYVIALPKAGVTEDEHGELLARGKVSSEGMRVVPIPKEGR